MKLRFITSILLLLFCHETQAQNADINMLRKINLNRNVSLDPTFRFVTNTAVPISIATPFSMIGIGLINHDEALTKNGITSGASLFLAIGLSTGLKYAIHRERPFITYPEIQKETSGRSWSFPSGHTTAAFATATSLSLSFPKWYVIAPSYLWAGAVAYSRMDLGVHYPSDVLGGMIIGIGSSFLCYKAQQWIKK